MAHVDIPIDEQGRQMIDPKDVYNTAFECAIGANLAISEFALIVEFEKALNTVLRSRGGAKNAIDEMLKKSMTHVLSSTPSLAAMAFVVGVCEDRGIYVATLGMG